METVLNFLQTVNTPPVIIGLFATAIVLVLIDFYFPVDWPAHIGYASFGAGVFLVMQLSLISSVLSGVAAWMGLEILHQVLFSRFLTNAPSPVKHELDDVSTKQKADDA